MKIDPAVLSRLGLPEDADETAINAALANVVPALAPAPVAASADKPETPAERRSPRRR